MSVPDLNKPAHQWCVHALPRKGCAIYGAHPEACKVWRCGWLEMPELDDTWKPERCGMVLHNALQGVQFVVDVDPAKPDVWRREPYYSRIKQWARASDPRGLQVVVYIGRRVFCMFPDEEIDVGELEVDEFPALAVHYNGELARALVLIRSRSSSKVLREVTGRWRPKAALPMRPKARKPS
jgi:hypothetical protein